MFYPDERAGYLFSPHITVYPDEAYRKWRGITDVRDAAANLSFEDLGWLLLQSDIEWVLWLVPPDGDATALSVYLEQVGSDTERAREAVAILEALRERLSAACSKRLPLGRFVINRQEKYLAEGAAWLADGGLFDMLLASMSPENEQE